MGELHSRREAAMFGGRLRAARPPLILTRVAASARCRQHQKQLPTKKPLAERRGLTCVS